MTVGSLGEFGLITALAARMPAGPFASLGIGDDSAVVAAPSGSVVAAVDMLIEDRHFRRDWSSGHDAGVKAAARGLADIAAMGAVPTALLVAFAAPASLPASWALDLAAGLAAEAERAGAGVVGGDTASAESVLVSVTALGDLRGVPPLRRSGARDGDVVAVRGALGHSAAGYALLSAGDAFPPGSAAPDPDSGRASAVPDPALAGLVAAHLRPAPPYDAGPEAARLGATAMIDVSDGLLADLGHIAAASGVAIDVSSAAVVPPADAPLWAAAFSLHGTDRGACARPHVLRWVLTGGEDHPLVATFPPAAALPPHWRVIGTVRSGGGVTVDGEPYAGEPGWRHFG